MKKRRGRNEGAIFQRKSDGLWIARWSVLDEYGLPLRKQRARKTKAAALEALALARTAKAGSARGSTGEYLERWLRDVAAARIDAGSLPGYRGIVRNHIAPEIGRIPLSKLDAPTIAAFYAALTRPRPSIPKKRGAKPVLRVLGPATRRKVHVLLRHALEQAVRWDLIAANPCDRVDPPIYRRKERPTLDGEQIAALLARVAADRLAGVYLVALSMGIRQGEIFGMQWADIDLELGTLRLRSSLQERGGRVALKGLKHDRQRRTLPIPPIALEALRDRRRTALAEGNRAVPYVFCTPSGRPIHKSNFWAREWGPLRRELGLDHVHFHDLRHTVGRIMQERGVHILVARDQLGHASSETTAEIYGHSSPEHLKAVATLMDQALREAVKVQ